MKIGKYRETLRGWFASLAAIAPERIYLAIALIGVVGFALLTPPFQGPDEEVHFTRLLYITEGYLIPVDVSKDSNVGLPSSVETVIIKTFFVDDLRGNTSNKYELFRTSGSLNEPYDSGKEYHPIMAPYSPIPYLAAVPATMVSNLANLSPLVGMYIARLSLGVFAVLIMYVAIRIIPSRKYLLAAIGLLPMLLFQHAMVSADGVSYAILALFFAYILFLYKKSTLTKKDYVFLGVLVVILALSKTLLYLFLPLIFILWNKAGARRWIIGSLVAAVTLILAWSAVTGGLITNPPGVDSTSQLQELKERPLRWVRVVWNTYMTGLGDGQTRGVIGVFGSADTTYPLWIVMACFAFVVIAILFSFDEGKRRIKIPRYSKWVAIIICAGYFMAVNLAMYLNYSPVGFNIVYGVQGRYFLPIVLALVFVLIGSGIVVASKTQLKLKLTFILGFGACVLLALLIVAQRYYWYTP